MLYWDYYPIFSKERPRQNLELRRGRFGVSGCEFSGCFLFPFEDADFHFEPAGDSDPRFFFFELHFWDVGFHHFECGFPVCVFAVLAFSPEEFGDAGEALC